MEAYRSNFAFAEFYGLRVGKLIAESFLCIKFFDLVLILGRAVFVRVNRECFRKDFACGIGRILGAVTILDTCYAELDALDYAILGSLYDFELCVFLRINEIIRICFAILGDYNIKITDKLTTIAALCLMHDVCAVRQVLCDCHAIRAGGDVVALGLFGCIVTARRLEVNIKLCTLFFCEVVERFVLLVQRNLPFHDFFGEIFWN